MPKIDRLGPVLVLLLALAGFASAEDDAAAWLEKMTARTQDGHYRVTVKGDMNITQGGMRSVLKMDGALNFATPELFRVMLDMNMDMGGQPMAIKMLSVADGTNFWVQMDSMMGRQVVKGSVEDLEKVAGIGGGAGMGGIGSNPINEITRIIDHFDMKVVPGEDGRVVLHADVDPTRTADLADLGPFIASMKYVRLEIDEKERMPVKLLIGGANPIVTMDFVDYEFFSADTVQASDYTYSPPEGAQVNDITGMVGQ